MPSKTITTIIFDLGRVLVDFDPLSAMKDLNFSESAFFALQENIFAKLWEDLDAYQYGEKETLDLLYKAVPGYEKEVDRLWEYLPTMIAERSYASAWLKDLKDRGYKIYLLSNFGRASFELCAPTYDFVKYVDGGVISYEVQAMKPDRRIFDELKEKYHLIPEQCIFVDDRRENVEAAMEYGYNGALFMSYPQAKSYINTLCNSED